MQSLDFARAWLWGRQYGSAHLEQDAYIYSLICPIEKKIRYVGRTQQPLKTRLTGHVSYARSGRNDARSRWIRSQLTMGLPPRIQLLETLHPCSSLLSQSRYMSCGDYEASETRYDIYVSERETRWYLWAIQQGCDVVGSTSNERKIIRSQKVDFRSISPADFVWERMFLLLGYSSAGIMDRREITMMEEWSQACSELEC